MRETVSEAAMKGFARKPVPDAYRAARMFSSIAAPLLYAAADAWRRTCGGQGWPRPAFSDQPDIESDSGLSARHPLAGSEEHLLTMGLSGSVNPK
jgi:hypothetical protein